ncbi:glutamate--tRNA ligase family protein [Dactylosporangium sp. NPDC051485]|uniref:glutamate--tRNA ligase n=1 Tax=Dactylosporangium sp. NPDC051485 TaxID=3154846 RepID=UPI003423B15B
MLDRSTIDGLFPASLPEPDVWQERYPDRVLAPGAKVTRFSPSPTGHLHIGGVYAAMIDKDVALHSGGTYFVRVEDTDQSREIDGAKEQFWRAFEYFGIEPLEDDTNGVYGPYLQSARADIYLTYVRQLLREGKAYLCFASREELAAATAAQQAAKVPTGYYGAWALWRDASPVAVADALAEGRPYVVRFRSPGVAGNRVQYVDAIRGRIEMEDNYNDVVILKSSNQPLRLPTYHFAHAVDDHLMRVNLVLRAEEWIPSVALHLQLFAALGFPTIEYAHIAQLLKKEGSSKRKLSKRKDPEASVDFYVESGFPVPAVLYYLRGLANGRLATLPLTEALAAPILLSECGSSGALADLVKLEDICADHVATMPSDEIYREVLQWAATHDPELWRVMADNQDVALRALKIEREGVPNPRKDLKKWSDFRPIYGYFFHELFPLVHDLTGTPMAGIDRAVMSSLASDFARSYTDLSDPQEWFDQIRALAQRHEFAATPKEHKAAPEQYHGSVREVAQIVRVALTGSTRSPDLHAVAASLGEAEVIRRMSALTA